MGVPFRLVLSLENTSQWPASAPNGQPTAVSSLC